MTCEDYPCCGHGPPPHGDGGGCPDSEGRFSCVLCGAKLAKGAGSSICPRCTRRENARGWGDESYNDGFQELADPFGAGW